ncbi:hypothetical protein ACO0RG_004444 [Hanseniaspora osmophila]|uniref:V-type proton ATPase subunit H n=1 Tax=Hanseniaspora osmophila TaxID=56408 RepID=A0A1E5RAP4_9ASCO|nr:V-type proton ATPase subunit H [Hanseniaspora osmophila]
MFMLKDSVHFDTLKSQVKFQQTPWDSLVRSGDLNKTELDVLKNLFQNGVSDSSNKKDLDAVFKIIKTTDNIAILQNCYSLLVDLFISEKNKPIYEIVSAKNVCQEYLQTLLDSFKKIPKDASESNILVVETLGLYTAIVLLLQVQFDDAFFANFLSNVYFPLFKKTFGFVNELQYTLIRYLQELAAVSHYRSVIFSKDNDFVDHFFEIILSPISKNSNNSSSKALGTNQTVLPNNNLTIQIQYYSLLTIWLLTFENSIASKISTKYATSLLKLLRLVTVTIKEKITRLSISVLLNCCKNNKNFLKRMILLNNSKTLLANLSNRKFSDTELVQDLSTLNEMFDEITQELNSFDEYTIELDSKELCWSPPHVDTQFWYDNVDKFRENNWKLLKKLCDLITEFSEYSASSDSNAKASLILQVVLSDMTHIVEMLPDSVEFIEKYNAKIKIMELLNYPDSKVKYEALKTTQALVKNSFK